MPLTRTEAIFNKLELRDKLTNFEKKSRSASAPRFRSLAYRHTSHQSRLHQSQSHQSHQSAGYWRPQPPFPTLPPLLTPLPQPHSPLPKTPLPPGDDCVIWGHLYQVYISLVYHLFCSRDINQAPMTFVMLQCQNVLGHHVDRAPCRRCHVGRTPCRPMQTGRHVGRTSPDVMQASPDVMQASRERGKNRDVRTDGRTYLHEKKK